MHTVVAGIVSLLVFGVSQAWAACGYVSYECTGTRTLSGSFELEDYDAPVPLDRACYGVQHAVGGPSGPLDGLLMVLAGKNRSEPRVHRLCFAWALAFDQKRNPTSASMSSDNCFMIEDGTAFQITGGSAHGTLNCNVKVSL